MLSPGPTWKAIGIAPLGLPVPRSLLTEHLRFDRPSRAFRLPGPVLLHLHHYPHRCEQPAVIRVAPHPASFQLEALLDQPLHGLHGIAPLLVEPLMLARLEHLDHPLARRTFVRSLAGSRQEQHLTLALEL